MTEGQCDRCEGTGKAVRDPQYDAGMDCPKCGGTGKLPRVRVAVPSAVKPWDWADQFAWDFEKHYGHVGEKLRVALAAEIRSKYGCPECGKEPGDCDHD